MALGCRRAETLALSGGRPCFTPSLHKDRRFLKRRKQVSGANEDAREFSALSGLSGEHSLEDVSPLPRLQQLWKDLEPGAKARAHGGGGVGEGAGGSRVDERVSVRHVGLKVLRSMFPPS